MTTQAGRREHVARALKQRQENGNGETYRVPLRGGLVVEVIEVPLTVPVLNADSFRIAPHLLEHPQADLVRADPASTAAQDVVSTLVRKVHRNADELKENLLDEGQAQPGVITRDGKLVNANTRCVLLRELAQAGARAPRTLRVAVLPADVDNTELLELELALQNQKELKDEYNLISSLLMVKRLHDHGLTDAAIGRNLRLRAPDVRRRREMLDLIDRARSLVVPMLPRTVFITEKDQYENWGELLNETKALEGTQGPEAADRHIRGWLVAYLSGITSVHRLRGATDGWVETDLLPTVLQDDSEDGVLAGKNWDAVVPDPAGEDPAGLDVLGADPKPEPATDAALQALLDLTAAARQSRDGHVRLPDGSERSGPDVAEAIQVHVVRSLDSKKRREAAGTRLNRPGFQLAKARDAVSDALIAISEVAHDPAFAMPAQNARLLAAETSRLAARAEAALQDASGASGSATTA